MKVSGPHIILISTILLALVAIPVIMRPPTRGDVILSLARFHLQQRQDEQRRQQKPPVPPPRPTVHPTSDTSLFGMARIRELHRDPPVAPFVPVKHTAVAPPTLSVPPALSDWPVGLPLLAGTPAAPFNPPTPRPPLPPASRGPYIRPAAFSAHFVNTIPLHPKCEQYYPNGVGQAAVARGADGGSQAPCEKRQTFKGEFTDDLMVILPHWWKTHRYNCCSTSMAAPGDGAPYYWFGDFQTLPSSKRGYVRFTDPLTSFPSSVWEPPPMRAHYENDYFRFTTNTAGRPVLMPVVEGGVDVPEYDGEPWHSGGSAGGGAGGASEGGKVFREPLVHTASMKVGMGVGGVRRGEKPIWAITNKMNAEWAHEPFNWVDAATITTVVQIIARKYTPVYIRHTSKVIDLDKQAAFYDPGELDVLRSEAFRAAGVVVLEDLYPSVKKYNVSFNDLQLMVLANAQRYSSVQGGNCLLMSYWGKTNVVYVRYGPEIGHRGGYFTLYERVSGAKLIPTHWYDDYVVETLRIVEPWFKTQPKKACLEWVYAHYPSYRARRDETIGPIDGLQATYLGGWYERHHRLNRTH